MFGREAQRLHIRDFLVHGEKRIIRLIGIRRKASQNNVCAKQAVPLITRRCQRKRPQPLDSIFSLRYHPDRLVIHTSHFL